MRTFILLAVALLLDTPAVAQLPVEAHPRPQELLPSADPVLAANKKLVFDFWRVVLQAHQVERAPEYVAEGHVLVSIVAERDLVVLAFRRELPDLAREGQTYTTTWFDMFRVADGKIVEHWDYGTKE